MEKQRTKNFVDRMGIFPILSVSVFHIGMIFFHVGMIFYHIAKIGSSMGYIIRSDMAQNKKAT